MDRRSVHIVIGGAAGQGLKTVEKIISNVCKKTGFHVYSTREYESRIRGGVNTTSLLISSPADPVTAHLRNIDLFISLTADAVPHVQDRLHEKTICVGENADSAVRGNSYTMSAEGIAKEIGGAKFASVIAAGLACSLLDIDESVAVEGIRAIFTKAGEDLVEKNMQAYRRGSKEAEEIRRRFNFDAHIEGEENATRAMYLAGSDTIAAGALAAGCTFVASYPMSPGTAVLTALGVRARDFGIVVEQAEDEIAAANMVIGAWYAGARALATTSGGGYALMTESLSLSGVTETPMLIHIAQRPGPGTGLPTRTSQGDLAFAVGGGHGYFPRAIFAPATVEDGFRITAHAFQTADAFQVPVILLSDQYYMDTHDSLSDIDTEEVPFESYVVKSDANYRRYAFTGEPVSPRSIPGFGDGVVKVDSDEHDEAGHITESMEMRKKQVEKRRRKEMQLRAESLKPKVKGTVEASIAVIAWGSTEPIIQEALRRLSDYRIAHIHFQQLYPLGETTAQLLKKYDKRILIEDSPTGAFADVVIKECGVDIEEYILKDDGFAFYVEELVDAIRDIVD